MRTSAPHPSRAVFASVDGTANPKSTMIGPMIASCADRRHLQQREREDPRRGATRGSTPRSCSERVPARRRCRLRHRTARRSPPHVADQLRRRDERQREMHAVVVVDQHPLQHPGEVEHEELRGDERDQPPPVDLDQLVRRRQHTEDRRREQVDDPAGEDPRDALADHAPDRGAVDPAQAAGGVVSRPVWSSTSAADRCSGERSGMWAAGQWRDGAAGRCSRRYRPARGCGASRTRCPIVHSTPIGPRGPGLDVQDTGCGGRPPPCSAPINEDTSVQARAAPRMNEWRRRPPGWRRRRRRCPRPDHQGPHTRGPGLA